MSASTRNKSYEDMMVEDFNHGSEKKLVINAFSYFYFELSPEIKSYLKLWKSWLQIMNKLLRKLNTIKWEIFLSTKATKSHNFACSIRIFIQKSWDRFCQKWEKTKTKMKINLIQSSVYNVCKSISHFDFRLL